MQKNYRQILFRDIRTCLILMALLTVLLLIARATNALQQWMLLIAGAFGYAIFILAIATRLVLFQVGKDPEVYRQYFSLPITRLKEKRASMGGGRPRGSLKGGRSIHDDDVLTFLIEAQKRLDEVGYGAFVAYCDQKDENPSTVSGWLKRYKKEIDHARN
ncbi:MAG: hypothetical protein ACOYYS_06110 [Chloroflexota bacterium]